MMERDVPLFNATTQTAITATVRQMLKIVYIHVNNIICIANIIRSVYKDMLYFQNDELPIAIVYLGS